MSEPRVYEDQEAAAKTFCDGLSPRIVSGVMHLFQSGEV